MRNNVKISVPISTPTTNGTSEKPVSSTSITALSWFTQATIILALIPFVGYLFSLSYEASFCGYFSIPYYLISISPSLVLSMTIGTVTPFTPIIISIFLIIMLVNILGPPLHKFLAKNRRRFLENRRRFLAAAFVIITSITSIPYLNLEYEAVEEF
jgi:hypothetical protein